MKKTVSSFFFLLAFSFAAYTQTKIFLDKDFVETTEKEAEYYRIIEKRNNLFLIKDYYITGELQFEALSHTNKDPYELEGEVKTFDKNGQLIEQRNFKNNIPVGEMIIYYSNGKVKEKGQYLNGQFDGLYTEYFPSGDIANQGTFSNGVINGTHSKYKSPKQLEYKITYKSGALDGPYEFYNSSGKLFNRGNAKDNFQQGKCYDYFYEGALRKEYTINNKKLDEWLIEYSDKGEVVGKGEFKDGVPLSYKMVSHGTTNGSKFSTEMQLIDGIENWKIYRDSVLIVKSYYKNGMKYGVWQVYTYDGSSLFQTRDYSITNCKDQYLQTCREKFDPFFFLSKRFSYSSAEIDDDDCNVQVNQISKDNNLHPFFYYKSKKTSNEKKANSNIIEYKDPSNKTAFKEKNKCVDGYKEFKDVSVCTREINNTIYKIFVSENLSLLKTLKYNAKPKDNEVYFYYQKFRDGTYDFSKEPRPDRYMGFTLPDVLKEAILEKKFDSNEINRILEHEIWNISDFSGFASDIALQKELK